MDSGTRNFERIYRVCFNHEQQGPVVGTDPTGMSGASVTEDHTDW
jgi:hypothetical protein